MEYSQFPFDNTYQGCSPESPAYHGLPIPSDFDATDSYGNGLDYTSHNGLVQSIPSWSHTSMQRFLTDNQRQPMFNLMPQTLVPSLAPPVASIPPVGSQQRDGSPFSSQDHSHCGSVLSPRADTDLHTDHMPATPPDLAMFPSFHPAPFDPLESSQQLFLSSVGGFPGDGHTCVSMSDVSPAHGVHSDWKEAPAMLNFDSQRSFTFGSQASVPVATHAMSRQSSIDQGHSRPITPEGSVLIKDEVHLPEQPLFSENVTTSYPTPSVRDSEFSDVENMDSPNSQEEDDDDEYEPNKKRTSFSTRRTVRTKRDAPTKLESSPKRPRVVPTTSQPARPLPPSPSGSKPPYYCNECGLSFKDEMSFQGHVKKQHTRPFICVFHFAGCNSTFASKNEWKRHVMSQHLVLHYWLCDIDTCAHTNNSVVPSTARPRKGRGKRAAAAEHMLSLEPVGPPLPDGAIFNRKDLYTQHIRRMHAPAKPAKAAAAPSKKNSSDSDPATADWEEEVKALQTHALRERCQLPTYMECPAPRCCVSFTGADAWDQRMEHVARHLEKAALGQEEPVVFGGPADPSLMEWVMSPNVNVVRAAAAGPGAWVLNNPLRAASEGRGVGRKRDVAAPAFLSAGASSSAVGVAAFSVTAGASVKGEMVCEEDEDAPGEDE